MTETAVTQESNAPNNVTPVTSVTHNAMPLTNAERQARYRARRKEQAQGAEPEPRTASTDTKGASPKTARTSTKSAYKPKDTTPALEQPETNGSAHGEAEARASGRDDRGRFIRGHTAGGRPPGARNKLTEDFIEDFHDAWLESGPAALKHMVKNDPSAFVKAAVQLMPKDVLVQAHGAGLVLVETPAAIRALLEALPDLGVLPLTGPVIDAEVDEVPDAAGEERQ